MVLCSRLWFDFFFLEQSAAVNASVIDLKEFEHYEIFIPLIA